MPILNYDPRRYPLAEAVAQQLGVADLARLHEGTNYTLFSRENDQSTVFHKRFYAIGDSFYTVYRAFIGDIIRPFIGEDMIYQRVPSFRVHLPNNVGVGEFHRDRDYFHDANEINFWLPLTRAWGSNTIWIESQEGREDYRPAELEYGQLLQFDGVNLKHGNKINETGATRVSIDFRIVKMRDYHPNERRSINTKMRFVIGEYFAAL